MPDWNAFRPDGDDPIDQADDQIQANFEFLEAVFGFTASDGVKAGNKAGRPGSPVTGSIYVRTDVTPNMIERYNGSSWVVIAGPSVGSIELWNGSVAEGGAGGTLTARPGWALCDGDTVNGFVTPNLKGRFVAGYDPGDADYNAIGDVGGEKTHVLTTAELPVVTPTQVAHRHYVSEVTGATPGSDLVAGSGHAVSSRGQAGGSDSLYRLAQLSGPADGGETSESTPAINSFGSGAAHENRPPFYTMAYIVFTDVP